MIKTSNNNKRSKKGLCIRLNNQDHQTIQMIGEWTVCLSQRLRSPNYTNDRRSDPVSISMIEITKHSRWSEKGLCVHLNDQSHNLRLMIVGGTVFISMIEIIKHNRWLEKGLCVRLDDQSYNLRMMIKEGTMCPSGRIHQNVPMVIEYCLHKNLHWPFLGWGILLVEDTQEGLH